MFYCYNQYGTRERANCYSLNKEKGETKDFKDYLDLKIFFYPPPIPVKIFIIYLWEMICCCFEYKLDIFLNKKLFTLLFKLPKSTI